MVTLVLLTSAVLHLFLMVAVITGLLARSIAVSADGCWDDLVILRSPVCSAADRFLLRTARAVGGDGAAVSAVTAAAGAPAGAAAGGGPLCSGWPSGAPVVVVCWSVSVSLFARLNCWQQQQQQVNTDIWLYIYRYTASELAAFAGHAEDKVCIFDTQPSLAVEA